MRNSLHCSPLYPILFLLSIVSTPMMAQPIDSVRPMIIFDSTGFSTSVFYGTAGISPTAVTSLNAALAENGFGQEVFPSGFLEANTLLGIGLQREIRRWMVIAEFAMLRQQGQSANGTSVSRALWQTQFSASYFATRSGNLLLYPLAGFGWRFNQLSINDNRSLSFRELLDSADRSFDVSTLSAHVELGLGADYSFLLYEDERSVNSILVGLRGGYLFGVGESISGISGGPDMSVQGLHLALTLGYRMQPRVYDATIVVERPPTSGVGH